MGLLNKQPAKFGKLLLTLRKGGSGLEAIEKVYGWDEKKLADEWRAYVMGQGKEGSLPAQGQEEGPIRAKSGAAPGERDEQSAEDGTKPPEGDAAGDSSPEPIEPGKWVRVPEQLRNACSAEMRLAAAESRTGIEPVESHHVTLWAAKETRQTYLQDVQKLEEFFHTKCAEPLRSGLDKRSAHVILLRDHAEYEAWWRANSRLTLGPEHIENDSNDPFVNAARETFRKRQGFLAWNYCVTSLGEPDFTRRLVVGYVGRMYFVQLAGVSHGALEAGFVDWVEAAVFGSPSLTEPETFFGEPTERPAGDGKDWSLLVRQRMATHRATPPRRLLQMNMTKALPPHYAEAWTLVGLLNKQPAKFGKLLLEIRKRHVQDGKGKGGSVLVKIGEAELEAIREGLRMGREGTHRGVACVCYGGGGQSRAETAETRRRAGRG